MASNYQEFITEVKLNSESARNKLQQLRKETEDWIKKRDDLINNGGSKKDIDNLTKIVQKNERAMFQLQKQAHSVSDTLNNMSSSSLEQLLQAEKALNREMRMTPQNTEHFRALSEKLRQVKTQIKGIKDETLATQSLWTRTTDFFNRSWGLFMQGIAALTGLTLTVRKCVQSFAEMEEAMADTRKYTGMSMEGVRELNEELKKMDTRTSREELNELAGSAGRLGIQSKEKILEFVDAANMINVSLGDDLGEGAIDQVGKLAMAFGEDDRLGLRGAMLATGSAINELAQNSSANAGYLVDFTARVGAFGKALGLTQAQIMGFGAVMDENLLREEMSATAFGNMLTKMQTDTAKFAKIAGKDVQEFTKLVKEDANAAVLALADNLRKQDSSVMMKMLDDMGLDGARAIGVLSTLADKIDDVRKHQERATQAYAEQKSIQEEYNVMNNTVQAQLDKAKKGFHEIAIQLGEKLQPLATKLITTGSLAVKVLAALVDIVTDNWKMILVLAGNVTVLTATYKAASIQAHLWYAKEVALNKLQSAQIILTKAKVAIIGTLRVAYGLLTLNITKCKVAMEAMRAASLTNPYTALLAVVLTLGTAIYGLVEHFRKNSEEARKNAAAVRELKREQELMKSVNVEANSSIAEEMTRFKQLRKTLEDNTKSYAERKKALDEIKKICPSYHGQLTTENRLVNSNTAALNDYCTNLIKAARAQAAFNKMVKIQEESLNHANLQNNRQANQKWVEGQLSQLGATSGSQIGYVQGKGNVLRNEYGQFIRYISAEEAKRIARLQQVSEYNQRRIKEEQQILDINEKQTETLQRMVDEGKKGDSATPAAKSQGYVTDAERKALEREKKKQEQEERERERKQKEELRKRADAVKAEYQAEIAEEMWAYGQGVTTYTDYMEERHRITQNYYNALKRIYGEDSTEYKKMMYDREKDEQEYRQYRIKETDEGLIREKLAREFEIRRQFYDRNNAEAFMNEEALNEALFQSDMQYLRDKQQLYYNGSKEWIDIEHQIQEESKNHQFEMELNYLERLQQYRNQFLRMGNEQQLQIAMQGLEDLHRRQLLSEEEYQRMRLAIQSQYAQNPTERRNEEFDATVNDAIGVARTNATGGYDKSKGMSMTNNPIMGEVAQYRSVMQQLQTMREQDQISHQEYEQAKAQVTSGFLADMVSQVQAAYETVNQVMQAASSYYAAQSQYEQAVTTRKYDREIEAAGNNEKKRKKIEEQKQKELAKIKTKYNKKAMKMEIAQAFASTAMAAINSYASASKEHWLLGAVAAAMATAAGMMQIAAIKKQHAAEEAGYYEGGFTGGSNWRKRAGVVHEGEFVVNHDGVANPNLLPILRAIDVAQRNNTIGRITPVDIGIGNGGTNVVTPIVNVNNDNSELDRSISSMNETINRLNDTLAKGINADVYLDGPDGLAAKQKRYEQLTK